jgi:Tol biopolymer transport system component
VLKFVRSSGAVVDVDLAGLPPLNNGFVSWSPDGHRLAAVSLPGAFSGSIWIVSLDGRSGPKKLLDLPNGVILRGLTWSPDGSSLVVGRVQVSGDVFLAERSTPSGAT